MRNFSCIENAGPWRPGSLAEDLGGSEEEDSRWWKNCRNGNNQAMGQFANNRLWGFKVKFLKYLQELSWFITPS